MNPAMQGSERFGFWLRQNYLRIAFSLLITTLFILDTSGYLPIPLMSRIENIAYDTRIKMTTPGNIDNNIVIVDIDEKSLAAEGHWPWSRLKLRKLLDKLFDEYGIALLVMDMVFAEIDDSEILNLLNQQIDEQTDKIVATALIELRRDLNTDRMFAEGIKDRPVVLGYYFTHKESDQFRKGMLPEAIITKQELESHQANYIKASGYGANIDILQKSASGAGFIDDPITDSDGVFRRAPMLQKFDGALYQSLSLAAAMAYLGRKPEPLIKQAAVGGYQSIEEIRLGPYTIPVDDNAAVLIPFRGKQGSFPYVSATDIINSNLQDPYSLIGQIAFIGTTAPGLVDSRPTPIEENFPGVEIHANLLSGILEKSFKHRPRYAVGTEIILLLFIGLLLSLLLPSLSPIWSTLLVAVLLSGTILFNLYIWNEYNNVLALAQPILLILTLFLFNMSYGFLTESRSKRNLGKLFGQYIPPELVDEMAMDPAHYTVEGERRIMTVLFSDIRGFTSISEKLDPTELSELLNEFLTPMTEIIHNARGTIDKYMGDAIMAFWGAPLNDPDHAQNAMEAAQQMEFMVHELAKKFIARGWPSIQIGIGLNTGTMNVGNMGSKFRMAYTVLGDAVNLGARLESLTKQYGVITIVSEHTRNAVEGFAFRELDLVRVKGKDEPVAIFEPVCKLSNVSPKMQSQLDKYHEAQKLYRQQRWDEAYQLFLELHDVDTEFLLYRVYMGRIEDFRFDPPAEDWDGVFTHSSK